MSGFVYHCWNDKRYSFSKRPGHLSAWRCPCIILNLCQKTKKIKIIIHILFHPFIFLNRSSRLESRRVGTCHSWLQAKGRPHFELDWLPYILYNMDRQPIRLWFMSSLSGNGTHAACIGSHRNEPPHHHWFTLFWIFPQITAKNNDCPAAIAAGLGCLL